nr:MAG TPA: hypothetical protein [Caudoviricetes sp.]
MVLGTKSLCPAITLCVLRLLISSILKMVLNFLLHIYSDYKSGTIFTFTILSHINAIVNIYKYKLIDC